MTFHRFIYKIIWKSKVVLLLLCLCALFAVITALLHGSFHADPSKLQRHVLPVQTFKHNHAQRNPDELEVHEVKLQGGAAGGGGRIAAPQENKILEGYIEDAKKKALQMLQVKNGPIIDTLAKVDDDVMLKFKGLERKAKKEKAAPLKPFHSKKLAYDPANPPLNFAYFKRSEEKFCNGKFRGYFNEFAYLEDVVFDREFCHGRTGGEDIAKVLMQSEEAEYYTYEMGCIQMKCDLRPSYYFNNKNHLNDLMFSLQTKDVRENDFEEKVTEGFNILITRYEYANIYHTMTDWYSAFLLMNFFNKTQAETNILILDGHPIGHLDPVWPILFNSSRRLSDLQPRTLYKQLTFNILGYNSNILDHSTNTLPLVEEFSRFFLNSYNLPYNDKQLDCDKISVLFIWRRDYLAHPRKPSGEVKRKIANERELLEFLQREYPTFRVKGVQIDLFDMQQQLRYVSESDVLIGMHGAGLTHAFFLPKHAGLIELVPNYWSAAMEHFMAIARWRSLKYEHWVNSDPHNEAPNFHTTVPTQVINVLFKSVLRQMGCLPMLTPDDEDEEDSEDNEGSRELPKPKTKGPPMQAEIRV